MGDQNKQQPEPQVPAKVKNRGPRSLWIDRWKNGFGFTLRHFVVYPPESYMVMARERRLGLRQGNSNLNEPMDTIFVKAVHEGTSAEVAGLETGDRILSVNGETIVGKTYAQVVQQIHNTPERLNLLVVPKEEDIIQQYYSETAHNPKTNARPRLRSPEVFQDPKRASALSLPGTHRNVLNPQLMLTTRQQQISPYGSLQHGMYSSDSDTGFNQSAWTANKIGSDNRGTMEKHRLILQESRWGNNANGKKVQTDHLSVIKPSLPQNVGPSTLYPQSGGCRLSLDGGVLDRRESSSSSTLTDDSVIISRIRKSCEQKEEFLKNTATPLYSQIIAREFYARPQKFQRQVWPPSSSESNDVGVVKDDEEGFFPKCGKQSVKSTSVGLDSSLQSFPSESYSSEPGDGLFPWYESSLSRSQSEESDSVRLGLTQPKLHIVSRRTKQFETGKLEDEEDRTNFYRSELSRLSGKIVVPNVALRKQEFELNMKDDKPSGERNYLTPLENSKSGNNSFSSENRAPTSASNQINLERSFDFKHLSPDLEVKSQNKVQCRSSSIEKESNKEAKQSPKRTPLNRLTDEIEEKQRRKAVRQDSYLAAVKPVSSHLVSLVPKTQSIEVVRREKNASLSSIDDDRPTRRISYLKATSNDEMNINSDKELEVTHTTKSPRKMMYPMMLPGDIQRLRRIFEEYSGVGDLGVSNTEPPPRRHLIDVQKSNSEENYKIIKDGYLNCKVAIVEGKRAADRSWKQAWAILRGPYFSIHKDKQTEQADCTFDIRSCIVDTPQNYTKKKNVFRIKAETETEYWLQAEDQDGMEQWRKALDEQCEYSDSLSPKSGKKLCNLRTRSPTGQSPASKTRKSIAQEPPISPKSKTWKGKLGKQFRRIQGSGSPSSPIISYPEGATIKVPIELCPPSSISEYIPLIVERCTNIVEARGLEVVGIYRVPGNTAAVTALTEAVNKGIDSISPEDVRWNDVNVISSLLKSFFRNLPDSLFTSELYPKFIEADKIIDPKIRMITLRKLIKELPEHNFETLKHLLYHLKKIVSNSSVNKMETQNLAIVFGPTLLTTSDLISLVTDTSHQCRIVESLISHVDWFFSDNSVENLENLSLPMSSDSQISESPSNANLLLGNIHKIEAYSRLDQPTNKDMSPKDIVSSIISAANRKISKGKSKKLEKVLTQCESDRKTVLKKKVEREDSESDNSLTASLVSSFVGEMVRKNGSDLNVSSSLNSDEVIRAYSGLDASTVERIKKFEQETHAMLHRDPTKVKRDAKNWLAENKTVEMKLNQSKRELQTEKALIDNSCDLAKNTRLTQFSSQAEDSNIRRVGSFNSIHDITPNGSLKRFKSNKDETGMKTATSLDSLHEPNKSDSDDGNDLVLSLTKTFDRTLKSVLGMGETSSFDEDDEENKSLTEKAEYENVIEKQSKVCSPTYDKKFENFSNLRPVDDYEKIEDNDEEKVKKSKGKSDVKLHEKFKKFEISDTILRTKNSENSTNLKRSESLNKPDKPNVLIKLKRSESLNKSEKENDLQKVKYADFSKNDLKRSDSLTKYEKTETNLNKKKQQESGLKRSSSKEKENMLLVKLKRKNGVPDRSIKRRHTVGGTKDFDKLPWLDNRLQSEALENEKSFKSKEKRSLRTSSPDLGSSRFKATIESEGLSIEVSLLGSRGNVLATLRKSLVPSSSTGRPQSMPPVSHIFKLPLESHV